VPAAAAACSCAIRAASAGATAGQSRVGDDCGGAAAR
jgi:hypothetical protein